MEGQELNGLAQAHVVGKHAAQPQIGHLGHPGNAVTLIGAESGVESFWGDPRSSPWGGGDADCVGSVEFAAVSQPVGQIADGAGDISLGRLTVHGDSTAEGYRQGLTGTNGAATFEAGQAGRVGSYPFAP